MSVIISYESNSHARVSSPWPAVLDLLRYDLAYLSQDGFIPGHGVSNDGWVWLLREDGSLPAGLVPYAQRLCSKYGFPVKVADRARVRPPEELPLHTGLQLRDYQRSLVEAALTRGRGVIDAPPRSGKTTMGAAIIDAQPHPTLWIAPTKAIVRQTAHALKRMLPLGPDGVVELMGGWPKEPKSEQGAARDRFDDEVARLFGATVVVTTSATACKMPQRFYDSRRQLVIDEQHHALDRGMFHEINERALNVYHRFGMTGTHFRSDERTEILMDAVLSEVVGRVSVRQLVDLGFLAPVDFAFVPIEGPKVGPSSLDLAYRNGVLRHKTRNAWAVWAARALLAAGKRVIVLVKLIEHGEVLAELIPEATFVRGADGKFMTDDDVQAAISGFNAGSIRCLIGTSVLGEGIDLPAADALVYAKGGSASVTVTQDVFRVLTASPGKARAIVVDFADRHQDALLAQAQARGRIYASEDAFSVDVLDRAQDLEAWIGRRATFPALI